MKILPASASPTNALMSRVEKNLPESRDSISKKAGKEMVLRTACVALPALAVVSALYHALAATLKTVLLFVTVPLRAFDVKVSDSLKGEEILKHMHLAFSAAICAVVAIPMILHSTAAVIAAHKALLPSETEPKGPTIEVIEDEPSVRGAVAAAVVKNSGVSGPSAGALIKQLQYPVPVFHGDGAPLAPPMDSGIPVAPPIDSGIPVAPPMDTSAGSAIPTPPPLTTKKEEKVGGEAKQALFADIRGGAAKLKKAKPTPKGPKNALLAEIEKRAGGGLKKISEEEKSAIAKRKKEEAEKAAAEVLKDDPKAALNAAIAKKAAARMAAGAPTVNIDEQMEKRRAAAAAEQKPAGTGSLMDAMRARVAQMARAKEE